MSFTQPPKQKEQAPAGLALQFKKAFPAVFVAYAAACDVGAVRIGRVQVVERQGSPRFVINFPTKDDWRKPSKLEFIEAGLLDPTVWIDDTRLFGWAHLVDAYQAARDRSLIKPVIDMRSPL
mgnify:CR=1 FL=1